MNITWYVARLKMMSVGELVSRVRDFVVQTIWRIKPPRPRSAIGRSHPGGLPPGESATFSGEAKTAVIAAAERLLSGEWNVLGRQRSDLHKPDWFLDVSTGLRSVSQGHAFSINIRDTSAVGNAKYVWELSRHQHLTVLACAYYLTGREEFATRIGDQLESWWRANPFLRGVHWTSGIELGMRLISWVWIRRLLDAWPGAPALFELNPVFGHQLYHHQQYLSRLPSHHSSANNHLIAEAVGLFVSAVGFPMFRSSERWAEASRKTLERELVRQTFPSGINREQATAYHTFVTELALVALAEGELGGQRLAKDAMERITAMADSLAAIVDCNLNAPRFGDSDDAIALSLNSPDVHETAAVLSLAGRLVGALPWWPKPKDEDVRTSIFGSVLEPRSADAGSRPQRRPFLHEDAGTILLCDASNTSSEVWCMGDVGPLGYLSTAAHGHADALSIDLRVGGVPVLVDPGTFDYTADDEMRRYFRSTRAHNTLEIEGRDQAVQLGRFMWRQHPSLALVMARGLEEENPKAEWHALVRTSASGWGRAVHSRKVTYERSVRRLTVEDEIDSDSAREVRLSFHLGPDINCELKGNSARLSWSNAAGRVSGALDLPERLEWRSASGTTREGGWYSPSYGTKIPTTTLVGSGRISAGQTLTTSIDLAGTWVSEWEVAQ